MKRICLVPLKVKLVGYAVSGEKLNNILRDTGRSSLERQREANECVTVQSSPPSGCSEYTAGNGPCASRTGWFATNPGLTLYHLRFTIVTSNILASNIGAECLIRAELCTLFVVMAFTTWPPSQQGARRKG
jgi:hypothetical protein